MKQTGQNIFDPRLGKRPARFVGREDILRDARAMIGDPDEEKKVMIFSGIRGSGKTALLAEIKAGLDPGSPALILDDASRDTPELNKALASVSRGNEKNKTALILAGTPHALDELLKDERFSFLRGGRKVGLANVIIEEVYYLFEDVFDAGEGLKDDAAEAGRNDVLRRAAEATIGYPYLIQLIGYYLSKEENGIDDKAVDRAVFRAKIELYKNIHEPLVWSLSSKDRMFLWSMAQDEGASEFGEIAKRMDVSTGYASKYRERLIGADVIYSSAYGELSYTLPYMKEYVEKEYVERFGGEGGKRRL